MDVGRLHKDYWASHSAERADWAGRSDILVALDDVFMIIPYRSERALGGHGTTSSR